MQRRVACMWFPRLASDRALRLRPLDGPFALTIRESNTNRIHCLNHAAEREGLHAGMPLADARSFCPELLSAEADPEGDTRFLHALRRWATRYCPWVGLEGKDGLVLDVTGSTHLWGGEAGMLTDMRQRLLRTGLSVRLGIGDTRGAAWALARHSEGRADPGAPLAALTSLPASSLRIPAETAMALQQLGLHTIGDLAKAPRAPLTRRFGPELLLRLDQALGQQPEQITPLEEPPHYGVRISLPDPIGLTADVMALTERLLRRLCETLKTHETGARSLCLTLRRVDGGSQQVELRLAAAMRDPSRILPLFERGVGEVDAGFGIDQMRIEATQVEPLPVQQLSHSAAVQTGQIEDLITRVGTRIGLENIQRFVPADSHIPERAFHSVPAAWSSPESGWSAPRPRPLKLFPPEPIAGSGTEPPRSFRWRRMAMETDHAIGPERIAPEWWLEDETWRSGLRDYWHVQTRQGRRLWLFHTPQNPGWFVHGEFA